MKNPKQAEIVNLFAVSEGRLAKEEIMTRGNKEIFYRMLNNNYIRETAKGSGIFKATPKLKNYTEQNIGKNYNNGCSNRHSQIITKTVSLLPKNAITEGRYTGQNDIKVRSEAIKRTDEYKKCITDLKYEFCNQYDEKNETYLNSPTYQEKINLRKELSQLELKLDVLNSDTPFFTPDIEVNLSRQEMWCLLQQVEEIVDTSTGREYDFAVRNEDQIKTLLGTGEDSYTIGIEIVTENYGNREMFMHEVYELVTGQSVLYFC